MRRFIPSSCFRVFKERGAKTPGIYLVFKLLGALAFVENHHKSETRRTAVVLGSVSLVCACGHRVVLSPPPRHLIATVSLS